LFKQKPWRHRDMSDTDSLPGAGTPPAEPDATLVANWPAAAQEYVRELRQQNARSRIRATAAEAKLGDPNQTADKLVKATATIRDLKLDAALRESTIKHGADHALTRAILRDGAVYATLDPDGKDFTTALDELVGETVARHGALKTGSVTPVRSGSDITHGTSTDGPKPLPTREDIAAISRTNPQSVVDALHRGELAHLLRPA
jgi:hypothetical protein